MISKATQNNNKHKNKPLLIIMLTILSALIILIISDYITGSLVKDRIPGNVSINGINVSRMSTNEAKKAVNKALANKSVIINNSYHIDSIGHNVKVNKSTYENAIKAKPWILNSIPYHVNIPLQLTLKNTDDSISNSLISKINTNLFADKSLQESSLAYDTTNSKVITTAGRAGKTIIASDLVNRLEALNYNVSNPSMITVKITTSEPTIINNSELDKASSIVNNHIIIINDANQNKNSIITKADLLPALIIKSNNDISVSNDGMKSLLTDAVNSFDVRMIPDEWLMTPDGSTRIVQTHYGNDGVDAGISDLSRITGEAVNFLNEPTNTISSAGAVFTVNANDSIIHKTISKVNAPGDFNSENGSPWLQVNLTTQTVSAYRGSTFIKSFPVATGKPGHRTDNGVYYVNTKYRSQTMRGADYITPNVPWISYFNGGEGFHGAPWNTYNINHGIPSSHGCVNMMVSDAKWIYDFAPLGTKVEVIGSSPSVAR